MKHFAGNVKEVVENSFNGCLSIKIYGKCDADQIRIKGKCHVEVAGLQKDYKNIEELLDHLAGLNEHRVDFEDQNDIKMYAKNPNQFLEENNDTLMEKAKQYIYLSPHATIDEKEEFNKVYELLKGKDAKLNTQIQKIHQQLKLQRTVDTLLAKASK